MTWRMPRAAGAVALATCLGLLGGEVAAQPRARTTTKSRKMRRATPRRSVRPAAGRKPATRRRPASPRAPARKTPVRGFADLHAHLFAHLSYNGQWYHPSPDGTPPNPSWDNIDEQAMSARRLKQAHDDGLKIVVVSAVNFEPLCAILDARRKIAVGKKKRRLNARAWSNARRRRDRCADMPHVWKQLAAAREFERRHRWFKIVRNPADARAAIAQGKLAAVLAIEVSNLFDERYGSWEQQFERAYREGVRMIQPVHELDNRFSGAAIHVGVFKLFEALKSKKKYGDVKAGRGFQKDANGLNRQGLTRDGEALIRRMMARKMLVDVAHMSRRAIDRTFQIARSQRYYPLIFSHAHMTESSPSGETRGKQHNTFELSRRHADYIVQTGGMIGLRAGAHERRQFIPRGGGNVANDCHGSSKSFAQVYNYVQYGLKANVAFGSDFNGFIAMTQPRFGKEGCSATYAQCIGTDPLAKFLKIGKRLLGKCKVYKNEMRAQQKLQKRRVGSALDTRGLAHVGLLGDFVKDLKRVGTKTAPLERSAETFLRVWERAEGRRGVRPVARAGSSGRFVKPKSKKARKRDTPKPKCPVGLKKRGTHRTLPLCQAVVGGTIKKKRCGKKWGRPGPVGGWCYRRKNGYYKVRRLK